MRNLKLQYGLHVGGLPTLEGTQCVTVDMDNRVVYGATSTHVYALQPTTKQILHDLDLVQNGYLPADGSGVVVGIQHIPDMTAVCVVFSQGDVIMWNTVTMEVECVGSVNSGLQAVGWSPDLELLVLVTGEDSIIIMTREFEPLLETSLHPGEFGEAEFVNVGWGKKETQFHGSEGKKAAKQTVVEGGTTMPWDDQKPRVSWRGDGEFFCVSAVSPRTGARTLRMRTREGILHASSEIAEGIEQALSWKPSGSLIATSQRKPNKHNIVFFEKNGLLHGEFTLPFSQQQVQVRELSWNLDSTVLMVWCEELPPEGQDNFQAKSYIQLWTVNNYHWYLKQSLPFSGSSNDSVAAVCWDPEQVYMLHIVCRGGDYLQYTWCWATCVSEGHTRENLTTVGVIDGNEVLMTPFRKMVVPPPMSAYKIRTPSPTNMLVFGAPPNSNDLLIVLDDGRIALYKFGNATAADKTVKIAAAGGNGFKVTCDTPSNAQFYRVEGLSGGSWPFHIQHVCPLIHHRLLLITLSETGSCSLVHIASVDHENLKIIISSAAEMEDHVINISTNPETGTTAVQLLSGALMKLTPDEDCMLPWEDDQGHEVGFPQPCSTMAVTSIAGQEVVVGLTERFRLYINSQEVASNCTSFAIQEEFLLLTTHSHTCRCIPRATPLNTIMSLPTTKSHPFDESVRRVERGCRLVCVVPQDSKLILQMPRGNLETIHPRALVLSHIRKCLDRLEYRVAFDVMKKHRINLNLLHDHNPEMFMDHIKEFVQQIDSVSYINLFLTDLQEEDITQTMYRGVAGKDKTAPPGDKKMKVNSLCDTVREALEEINPEKYLLSILTAYVKKTKPELDTALHKIKMLRGDGNDNKACVTSEEALKYLVFLVDVNELYDVALSTYDFNLVMMVAEKSQKDPKEYVPFLNELRRHETNYQRFLVDKHLRRYRQALVNIAKCGDEHFTECLNLVQEQRLFAEALQIFAPGSNHFKDVAVAYGEYLLRKGKHEEAGLAYIRADDWQAAMAAFNKSLNWRQCLCAAAVLKYSPEQVTQLARDLAVRLKDEKRQSEAALLYDQYAQDTEEAIVTLIEGAEWEEALRLIYKLSRLDLLETNLRPGLLDAHCRTMEHVEGLRVDFDKYCSRLQVVREQKERARLDLLEGGPCHEESDLFSDTSSATGESVQSARSRSTAYSKVTGSSSRSRRKTERKKWSLKKGSAYEDLALIEALSTIIKNLEEIKDESAGLLRTLVQYNYSTEASALQEELETFLLHVRSSVPSIWVEDEQASLIPVTGPGSTANSIAQSIQEQKFIKSDVQLDAHLRVPPTLNKDNKWKLHVLTKQS